MIMRHRVLLAIMGMMGVLGVGCGSTSDSATSSIDPTCAATTPDAGETSSTNAAPFHASREDVEGILARNCAVGGCHASAPGAGNLVLLVSSPTWVNSVVGVPSHENPSMSLIKAGDPKESWIVHKITGDLCLGTCDSKLGCGVQMPFGASLSSSDRQTIIAWIADGALSD